MQGSSNKVWRTDGTFYYPDSISSVLAHVPPGVYSISVSPQTGVHLRLQQPTFNMPQKEYAVAAFNAFERITTSYSRSTQNVGVLLSGLKGTGKSVLAKKVAVWAINNGMPVVVVDVAEPSWITDIIRGLQQSAVFLFDEFEKLFDSDDQQKLLSVLDGTASSAFKHLFLFTANSTKIDPGFIDRPSRILYHWKFGNLTQEQTTEILKDMLLNPADLPAALSFAMSRALVSIDTVQTIAREVNNNGTSDLSCLNLTRKHVVGFRVFSLDENTQTEKLVCPLFALRSSRYLGGYGDSDELKELVEYCTGDSTEAHTVLSIDSLQGAGGAGYLMIERASERHRGYIVGTVDVPIEHTWIRANLPLVRKWLHTTTYLRLTAAPFGWEDPDLSKYTKEEDVPEDVAALLGRMYDYDTVYGQTPASLRPLLLRLEPVYADDAHWYDSRAL